mmetsp:Transcript_6864/g.20131  ORF Transcript_6864/g.20131 Transcript_6864/m.20131 type:complete len:188 (+) Transcript_6864:66-629(+)
MLNSASASSKRNAMSRLMLLGVVTVWLSFMTMGVHGFTSPSRHHHHHVTAAASKASLPSKASFNTRGTSLNVATGNNNNNNDNNDFIPNTTTATHETFKMTINKFMIDFTNYVTIVIGILVGLGMMLNVSGYAYTINTSTFDVRIASVQTYKQEEQWREENLRYEQEYMMKHQQLQQGSSSLSDIVP